MTARQKPITIRVGSVHVRIYRRTQRKASGSYDVFEVADYSSGRRRLVSFSSEAEARAKAMQIATKTANHEGAVLTLSNRDRESYLRALEFLEPTGTPLEIAAAQFAEAKALIGDRSLREAAQYFARRHPQPVERVPVAEAVSRMIEAKRADGASPVYLLDLKKRLGNFAEAFQCDLASVDEPKLTAWLRETFTGGRNRNNFRRAIETLYRWAEAEGLSSNEHLDFSRVPRAKEDETEIEVFRPDEMVKLLTEVQVDHGSRRWGQKRPQAMRSGLLALLLLGGFAGMRTAEVQRQRWADINLERGFIRVTGAKGNTAQKRLVPVSDNLRAWLLLCKQDSELVCDYPRPWESLSRVAIWAGVKWKHNALRHSYASYRVALTGDVARTALEIGNSPRMIHRHYREAVTEDEARAWFSIMPDRAANVVALPAASNHH